MSNFFRDSAHGFKPRSNIFSKLRNKDPEADSDTNTDNGVLDADWGYSQERTSNMDGVDSRFLTHETNISIANESTPKTKSLTGKNKGFEEEELEITEVRNVNVAHQHDERKHEIPGGKNRALHEQLLKVKNVMESSDTSTNEVLLEAFNNTQRICSNLKSELQRLKSENQQQSRLVSNYKAEIMNIEGKVGQYRQLLASIETKSVDLQKQKQTSEEQLLKLRSDYDELVERLHNYTKDSGSIRKLLEETRSTQKRSDAEIAKRLKELEYLKKELNNSSGLLSEEKLKNRDLMQELKKFREYSNVLLDKTLKKMDQDIRKELSSISISVKSTNSKNSTLVQEDLQRFLVSLRAAIVEDFKNENQVFNEQANQNFVQGLATLKKALEDGLTFDRNSTKNENAKINRVEFLLDDFAKKLERSLPKESSSKTSGALMSNLHDSVKDVQEVVNAVNDKLYQYSKQLTLISTHEQKIDGLHEKLHAVALQKSEAVLLIKARNTEIEELNSQLSTKSNSVGRLAEEGKELNLKVLGLERVVEAKAQEMSKMEQELQMTRVNCDNKLTAQNEILKLVTGERDRLQAEVGMFNQLKDEVEREKMCAKSKAKKINDQVQNLNVEVIQLKARELELDEENRKLKNTVEQLNLDSRESGDQVLGLKQKVVRLENEKNTGASENLDHQDKIALLEQQLLTVRKQMQNLKDQRHKVPQIKKHALQVTQHPRELQGNRSSKVVANATSGAPTAPASQSNDAFDLSSSSASSNDDLEMTNPSPNTSKSSKTRVPTSMSRSATSAKKKKLLLHEEADNLDSKHRGRKKRRF
ncbi:LADA_0E07294g1_1 [Lachancea dasiensis]|uniref:LADA_0E07294g1_1 n=1 Tax=Lachancea dasiensis TaxID=1072105 RepID=A0A1G4JCU6_9SACH|nr:LADA_0E07294g1_1 [Lachancea dasiensis]